MRTFEPPSRVQKADLWDLLILVCVTVSAFLIRLCVLGRTDNLDFESIFRTIQSIEYSAHPFRLLGTAGFAGSGNGGMKGFYFTNSLIMYFVFRPIMVTRIMALVFGTLVFIPYYLWIKTMISRGIALFSTALLVFYVPHVQLSVVPMGQAGCIFFASLGGFFLGKYLQGEDSSHKGLMFALAVLSVICATSFRIEGWIFPFLFSALLVDRRMVKPAALFLILSLAYVLYQNLLNVLEYGEAIRNIKQNFFFYRTTTSAGRPMLVLDPAQADVWLKVMVEHLSLPVMLLIFLGALASFRNWGVRFFTLGFMSILLVLSFRSIASSLPSFERYSVMYGIFALPLIFVAVEKISSVSMGFISSPKAAGPVFVAASLIICILTAARLPGMMEERMSSGMRFDNRTVRISEWMADNLASGDLYISSILRTDFSLGSAKGGFYYIDMPWKDLDRIFQKEGLEFLKDFSVPKFHDALLLMSPGDSVQIRRIFLMLDPETYERFAADYPEKMGWIRIIKREDVFVLEVPISRIYPLSL